MDALGWSPQVRRGYAAVVLSPRRSLIWAEEGRSNDRAHLRVAGLRCCPDGREREDCSTPDCRRSSSCLPVRPDPSTRPERCRRHVLSIPATDRRGTRLHRPSARETRRLVAPFTRPSPPSKPTIQRSGRGASQRACNGVGDWHVWGLLFAVIALPVGGSFRTGDDCQPGRHRAGSQACAVDRTADLGNALPCRRPAHRNASRGRNARRPSARRIGICKLAHHRRPDAHAGRWY